MSTAMKEIALSRDLLNSNKILFHYGKMLEEVAKGRTQFNPIAIEIHPTAMCNHRCIHCSYKERNESRATISKEAMDRLIDSIIHMHTQAVYFSGGGEPTLYPNLADYILKLTSHGIECSIITNGSCFNQMGLIPIANKLNYIAVSVPAVDSKTFEAITGTKNLEQVLALPGQIKAAHGDKSPIIGSRVVLTSKNYRQVGDFLNVLKARSYDYVLFKVVRDYEDNGQGLSREEEDCLKEEIQIYKDYDRNFTNITGIFCYREAPCFKNKCWINQYGLLANVSTDGKVYPSVVEIDQKEFCIGDINADTLEEMWNSERHTEVKRLSNEKWIQGACRNCRSIAYNEIINQWQERLPAYFDPFI